MGALDVDPEAMRAMGHRTVDALVDMLSDDSRPALRRATAAEMGARLPLGEPPAGPSDFAALLERLQRDVFPFTAHIGHPSFFAFIPTSPAFPSALGDFMASALNLYAGTWMEGAGPAQVELVVLDWFKRWIGYPESAAGLLLGGGSAANMTALACARETLAGAMDDRLVVYLSDQGHSSLARAARVLGFAAEQVRVLPSDASHRLDPRALAEAIDADMAGGLRPLFAAANVGATNTGAIDPMRSLSEVCRERGVWLHADAAYGGLAALSARGRELVSGVELADSVTLDPHKWLHQPYECGSLLVRQGELLQRAFEIGADYMSDVAPGPGEVNFQDLGFQQTRACRALKVWLSVSCLGLDAFRRAVDDALDLALFAERLIASMPQLELVSPASLGVVCFRRRASDDDNRELVRAFAASGQGLVASTRVDGRVAVRMCCLNHTSGHADVERVVDFVAHAHVAPPGIGQPASFTR